MKASSRFTIMMIATLCLMLASSAFAQNDQPQQPASGFRAEFLRHWADLEKKFVSLAQAMPQEKYGWRPGEGVRSVSEVFVHVAGGNYFLIAPVGVKPPEGLSRDDEKKITDKSAVVEMLKKSFEHVRQAILKITDADLDKPVKFFGRDATVREVLFYLATHQPEHLGQSIAYARMNSVVPPWTAERQTQQQQQKPK